MKRSTKAVLWFIPLAAVFAVIVAAIDEPSSVDSAAGLVGQLEALPAVSAADTVTILRTDPSSRSIEVDTHQGPRRYRIDDATRLRTPTTPIAFVDLEPGQRVVVTARRDGAGFTATDIVVVARGSEPAPTRETEEIPR